jgi:hypothetical protein
VVAEEEAESVDQLVVVAPVLEGEGYSLPQVEVVS